MNTLFRFSSLLVMPLWFLMIFLPRWSLTTKILKSPLVIVAPALMYVGLVLPRLSHIFPVVVNPDLPAVATLLSLPAGATIAWVHFLAFDLFVGRWIFLDSRERAINSFLMAPILFLTLMLGPLGFLLYYTSVNFAPVRPRSLFRAAIMINPPLAFVGGLMIFSVAATMIGTVVDHRVITGVPLWLKPAKFAISVCVYSFTFVWLLSFVNIRHRLARLAGNATAVGLLVEMVAIVGQAARGTTSHFNVSTSFDGGVWAVMATFIAVVFFAGLLLAILLLRQNVPDKAFAWSLRLGLILSLIGMAIALFMVSPSKQQLAVIADHSGPSIAGAHSVGVTDGGPGLPFLNWSTVGGDLRVPHFVGLHAFQVLPLLGWFLMRQKALSNEARLRLVWIAGAAYLGFIMLLLWQALQGESIIHPDGTILIAGATLATLTLVAIGWVIVSCFSSGGKSPQVNLVENRGSI